MVFIRKYMVHMLLNRFRIYILVIKMINYLCNVEKFVKKEAQFVKSLNEYFL